jgi:hypothetical protein
VMGSASSPATSAACSCSTSTARPVRSNSPRRTAPWCPAHHPQRPDARRRTARPSAASRCPVPTRKGVLPGLDVRGDGGYIVVHPSRHPLGRTDHRDADAHPEDVAIAAAPDGCWHCASTPPSAPPPPPTRIMRRPSTARGRDRWACRHTCSPTAAGPTRRTPSSPCCPAQPGRTRSTAQPRGPVRGGLATIQPQGRSHPPRARRRRGHGQGPLYAAAC